MTKRAEERAAYPPIEVVLPHRGPMLWLEALVSIEGHEVVCRARLAPADERSTVAFDGALMAVELFAQTAGALFGHRAWVLGLPFEGGALVGVRDVQLRVDALPVGEALMVHAREGWTADHLSFMRCRVEGEAGELASGTITVAVGRPPAPLG